MDCEVCGKTIFGKSHRVVIETSRLLVCFECAKLSSSSWSPKPKATSSAMKTLKGKPSTRRRPPTLLQEDLDLIENYGLQIRRARERFHLSHEDLGRKINEKVSVLQKLETSRLIPNQSLIEKLEHVLKIKLLVSTKPPSVTDDMLAQGSHETTLGDVLVFQQKKRRRS